MPPITVRLLKKPETPPAELVATPYRGQKYQDLWQLCAQRGSLFEDPAFPASPASLGYAKLGPRSEETQGMAWKRPKEICEQPKFVSQDMSRTDVCQGILGNCWVLAAAGSLSLRPELMSRVIPPGQSFQDGYFGIFHFQFWQYGQWVDVVIDDRLPVRNGQLSFLHSPEKEEFWAALLEKAYAKLNGSYENLESGLINEALVDFTGGIAEHINLKAPPAELMDILKRSVHMNSLMGASIEIKSQEESEARTPQGLLKGHAYSITGVNQVELHGRKVHLLRLRNPWGEVEWNGRWSDNSPMWSLLDASKRAQMQVQAEDGEFWMQLEDFLRYFDSLEVCNLAPDSLRLSATERWNVNTFQGRWIRGYNAGGCLNNRVTFWTNPQFQVDLSEVDGNEEPGCTLIVSLMQRDHRQEKSRGRNLLNIGFEIFEIPAQYKDLMHSNSIVKRQMLPSLVPVAMSQYINLRDVTLRCTLNAGQYLIIPSTFKAMDEAKFTLRIFTEKQQNIREIDDEIRADETAFQVPRIIQPEEKVRQMFKRFAARDGYVGAQELQQILNNLLSRYWMEKEDGFSLETCQQALVIMDVNANGRLGLEKFKLLWSKIKSWELIFSKYDADHSGAMDAAEIRMALEATGFCLNNRLTEIIIKRYCNELRQISYSGFLSCVIALEAAFRKCQALDKNKDGVLHLTRQEWVELSTFS